MSNRPLRRPHPIFTGIIDCQANDPPYTCLLSLNRNHFRMAIIPAVLLLGAGCSGINASHSISPASFFLPGLVQAPPAQAAPATGQAASPSASTELVQLRIQSQ